MKGGTLFSGIGAPEQAMPWVDWIWACEIEPFASAVLAARHPRVKNLGDVTKVEWKNEIAKTQPVDLIVFGSPCQSYSAAGKRLGLADPRGNLALVALGIVDALRPKFFLFENVPGLLSSNGGRDFGTLLAAVEDCGYGWAFRVIDSQYFGVPQRRRRLFLVGYCDPVSGVGDWRPPAAILFDRPGVFGNFAPRRQTRTAVARTLTSSPGGCSGKEQQLTFVDAEGRPLNALPSDAPMNTLPSNAPSHMQCFGGGNTSGAIEVSTTLTHHGVRMDFDTETFAVVGPLCSHSSRHGHAMTTQQAAEAGHIVAHALTARHDSSPDGTGRGVPIVPVVSPSPTSPIAFDSKQDGRGDVDIAPTLRAMGHDASHANAGGQIAVAYPLDLRNAVRDADKHGSINRQGLGVGNDGDPAPACTTGPVAGVAMAFQPRIGRSGRGQPSEIVPTLGGAGAGATSDSRPCVAVPTSTPAISLKLDNGSSQPVGGVEFTPPLRGAAANVAVYTRYAVRRLTPRECEFLQGFPADYTLIDYRGKPAADGPRYRALGNSMAVPVVAWIGRRIAMMDRLLTEWQRDGSVLCGGDGDGHNERFGLLELAGAAADGP